MTANHITVIRMLLTFGILFVFGHHHSIDLVVLAILPVIFVLDALDGYIARKRNEVSPLGECLDTLADRVIENGFWIYFTATGQLPVWMPIAVMARGFLTDALQRMHGYPTDGWTHALTRSRLSRAVSGITKLLAFSSLASALVFKASPVLEPMSLILATVAVFFCLLRGLPFFFRSRKAAV
jgi:CDP-diacylglycerol--glycerol-3-phosphate 3-phosphatidyltransferase